MKGLILILALSLAPLLVQAQDMSSNDLHSGRATVFLTDTNGNCSVYFSADHKPIATVLDVYCGLRHRWDGLNCAKYAKDGGFLKYVSEKQCFAFAENSRGYIPPRINVN